MHLSEFELDLVSNKETFLCMISSIQRIVKKVQKDYIVRAES